MAAGEIAEFGQCDGESAGQSIKTDLDERRLEGHDRVGGTNLTSLVERVSRFTVLMKNADRRSRPVMDGVIGSLSPLPAHARRSITFDRGLEFLA